MGNNTTEILSWEEHIRRRPGMYIGDLRQTGFKNLLEYFFEDVIKHALDNLGFQVQFYARNRFIIEMKNIDTNSFLNAMSSNETYKDRFGVTVLCALSSKIEIRIVNQPSAITYSGGAGNLISQTSTAKEKENQVRVDCTLDTSIFKDFAINYEQTNDYLQQFAMLNTDLKIISIDDTSGEQQRRVFNYPTGVLYEFDYSLTNEPYYSEKEQLFKIIGLVKGYEYRIGICYCPRYIQPCFIKTYAGNKHAILNGSLLDGALEGIKLAVKVLALKTNTVVAVSKKELLKNLTLVAAVKGPEYEWHGSTKWRLGMPQVKIDTKQLVYDKLLAFYEANPDKTDSLLNKFRIWPHEGE